MNLQQDIYYCEVKPIEIDGNLLGYQIHMKIKINWKCDLRVFLTNDSQSFWINPLPNDIKCLEDTMKIDTDSIPLIKNFFS